MAASPKKTAAYAWGSSSPNAGSDHQAAVSMTSRIAAGIGQRSTGIVAARDHIATAGAISTGPYGPPTAR